LRWKNNASQGATPKPGLRLTNYHPFLAEGNIEEWDNELASQPDDVPKKDSDRASVCPASATGGGLAHWGGCLDEVFEEAIIRKDDVRAKGNLEK
jgi:hypothetical protein